ncbi:MAG: DUF5703 family protein [Rothia sp. (in: high G+C Gram-positive bacteria)]|nr:DUF5703 family protein [Rothia sp. (in: high G+C Gram-positive bacteria)]
MREQEVDSTNLQVTGFDQRFEYLMLTVEPAENLHDARSRLNDHSEYGRWELVRSVILYGGRRRYLLRRRVIKVSKTVHFF